MGKVRKGVEVVQKKRSAAPAPALAPSTSSAAPANAPLFTFKLNDNAPIAPQVQLPAMPSEADHPQPILTKKEKREQKRAQFLSQLKLPSMTVKQAPKGNLSSTLESMASSFKTALDEVSAQRERKSQPHRKQIARQLHQEKQLFEAVVHHPEYKANPFGGLCSATFAALPHFIQQPYKIYSPKKTTTDISSLWRMSK